MVKRIQTPILKTSAASRSIISRKATMVAARAAAGTNVAKTATPYGVDTIGAAAAVGLAFYWQRPLGAADSVRRLTVTARKSARRQGGGGSTTTSTTPMQCWALPLTLLQLQREIRQCATDRSLSSSFSSVAHAKTKIHVLEVVGSAILIELNLEAQWEAIGQELQRSLPDLHTVQFVSDCTDADCALLLRHVLWRPNATAASTVASTSSMSRKENTSRVVCVSIQGGCGGFGIRNATHDDEGAFLKHGNYRRAFQALTGVDENEDQDGKCGTLRNTVRELSICHGAVLCEADTLYLQQHVLPRLDRFRLQGAHFANLTSYLDFLQHVEYESMAAVTVTNCTSSEFECANNSDIDEAAVRKYLQAREELVNWNAALQTLRRVLLHRDYRRRSIVRPVLSAAPATTATSMTQSNHSGRPGNRIDGVDDFRKTIDAAVTVLRDWYRSSQDGFHLNASTETPVAAPTLNELVTTDDTDTTSVALAERTVVVHSSERTFITPIRPLAPTIDTSLHHLPAYCRL